MGNPSGGGFLEDKGQTHQPHKGPADDCADGQPREGPGCPSAAAAIHEHAERQEDGVHGKGGRQIGNRGMKHASARDEGEQEEEGDARVHATRQGRIELRLTNSAACGEEEAQKVKLESLAPDQRDPRGQVDWYGVYACVEPGANGIGGRVLPGLQTVAMIKVVRRLPVVVGLVAILYR